MTSTILVVVNSFNIGGTERHLAQILPRLDRKKFNVVVYATHEKGSLASLLEDEGIKIYYSRTAKMLHALGKIGRPFAYLTSTFRLIYLMLRFRPVIVHCYLQGPYLLGGICKIITRCPILVMSRRITYNQSRKRKLLYRLEKIMHHYITIATACSNEVAKDMLEEGLPEKKIITIYNGVNLNRFSKSLPQEIVRKNLGISKSDFIIIIVANLHERKAHCDLLKALSIVKDRLPLNWRLYCLGRDVGQLEGLKKLSALYEIDHNIKWLGEKKDVLPYLCVADIGVSCSYHEGFSNALLESMAAGLSVVVTDISGNNEAVEQNKSGLIVPAHSPENLGRAILELSKNREMRKQLGKNAKQRVVDKFSLDGCILNYETFYETLLKNTTFFVPQRSI